MVDPDPQWLETWITEWGDRITQFAYLQTNDRELAQDIAQEAFFRLHRYHQDHPAAALSAGWLYTVARNLARDAQRRHRRQRHQQAAQPVSGVQPSFEADVTEHMAVQTVLRTLSAQDQDCLWLFYYADYSVQQIAAQLHLTSAGVRARLYRARQRFAAEWEGMHREEG